MTIGLPIPTENTISRDKALALGLFLCEEVISVFENRPMKHDEKLHCVYMRSEVFPGTRSLTDEISVTEIIFVPYEHKFLAWQDTSVSKAKENSSPYFYSRGQR